MVAPASGTNGSGLFSDKGANKPHLGGVSRPDGLKGEIGKLRADVTTSLAPIVAMTVDEFTNAPGLGSHSIKNAFNRPVVATTYTAVDFDGALHGVLNPPRPVIISCADKGVNLPWVGDAVVVGKDVDGNDITENITMVNAANTAGLKCFARVTSITIPAQGDALVQLSFGNDEPVGLSKTIKYRAGGLAVFHEVIAGVVTTPPTATVTDSTAHPPHGAYVPVAGFDGTKDYALYYEYDPTA